MSDRGAAEYLLDDRLLNEIFDSLENDAKEAAIYAQVTPEYNDPDFEMRRALAQVRAIRDVRAELRKRASAPPTNRPRAAVV